MSAPATSREALKSPDLLLANSARGATFLIILQIGSRALTFIVNQILLRYQSPELLGVSSQLELYGISVLYFARESLRLALQRGGGEAQEVVNLSYIAIALGPPLAYGFAGLYMRQATPTLLATPYVKESLSLYALATCLELLIEPCFVIAQQKMLYSTRASAESTATFTRCFLTCAVAIWASSSRQNLGVLPFAIGQLSYALVMNLVYYSKILPFSVKGGFSLIPARLTSNSSQYILSLFSRPILILAINLYAQSGLKHLLTQGDSLLIAIFASLSSQGVYALASNYGSLLARMLFQPIEESSRGVFGRLLAPTTTPTPADPVNATSNEKTTPSSSPANALSAQAYLVTLLRLYGLLSLGITAIGPTLAPLLLSRIAGPNWTHTSAGAVLSLYCYYIPLLAINGILEAFVSAVASPVQLREQSAWMVAFSAGFAGSGYLLLRIWEMGAQGLVLANAINMAMRILWSWSFVKSWLQQEGSGLGVAECLPTRQSMGLGVVTATYLSVLQKDFNGGLADLVKSTAVGGAFGLALLFLERSFLYECYLMLRPRAAKLDATKKES